MKHTKLYDVHTRLGAKMVPFAGYAMPVQYPLGIIKEHLAVRNNVGIFDVSHMGEVEVRGADAQAFVQKITTNDVTKLEKGKAQYSAMCYRDGGIVDDLLVYHCGDYYFLVINASNIEKDYAWMLENAAEFSDLEVRNVSDDYTLLAVQGPNSLDTLQKLTTVNLADIPYYQFVFGQLAGVEMIISRTGYTGEVGCELYFRGDTATAEKVWDAICVAGAELGIEPTGLGARDTLRLEKGFCLYGNDIDQSTNPIEAGLSWITKTKKGDFNGREPIVNVKREGVGRKLVGFVLQAERFIPRQHYTIVANGESVGEVTSGSISPVLNKGIGLGYVPKEYSEPGTTIHIAARGKEIPAEVVKPPFV